MYTEIVCIVDRSGSMHKIIDDAIGGFNAFVEEQKNVEGDATLTLVFFNHGYEIAYNGQDLNDVPNLTKETFKPSGTTALYDAIGRSIHDVTERLSKVEVEKKPSNVIVAIITDGMENASKDYSRSKIAEIIKTQESEHSWEFMFLAANMDAAEVAASMNISRANAVTWESTAKGTAEVYGEMSKRVKMSRMRK